VPHVIVVALRWAGERLQAADWWLADNSRGTSPEVAADQPGQTGSLESKRADTLEGLLDRLDVDPRALKRYRERVGVEVIAESAQFIDALRGGMLLSEPPRWLLFRPINIVSMVLGGKEAEADDAWVALVVRHQDRGGSRLVVTSCVSKAWYEGGGLAGARAALCLPPRPPELVQWLAGQDDGLLDQWREFRAAVRARGVILPSRPATAPAKLSDGDAYLVLDGEVIASFVWKGRHRLNMADIMGWQPPPAA
jgi:hypothetical protein